MILYIAFIKDFLIVLQRLQYGNYLKRPFILQPYTVYSQLYIKYSKSKIFFPSYDFLDICVTTGQMHNTLHFYPLPGLAANFLDL